MVRWWTRVSNRLRGTPTSLVDSHDGLRGTSERSSGSSDFGSEGWNLDDLEDYTRYLEAQNGALRMRVHRRSMTSLRASFRGAWNRSSRSLSSLVDPHVYTQESSNPSTNSNTLVETLVDSPTIPTSSDPVDDISRILAIPPTLVLPIPDPSLGLSWSAPDLDTVGAVLTSDLMASHPDTTSSVPLSHPTFVANAAIPSTPIDAIYRSYDPFLANPGSVVPVHRVITRPRIINARPSTPEDLDVFVLRGQDHCPAGRQHQAITPRQQDKLNASHEQDTVVEGEPYPSPHSSFATPSSTDSGLMDVELDNCTTFQYSRFIGQDQTPHASLMINPGPESPITPTPPPRIFRGVGSSLAPGRNWPAGGLRGQLTPIIDESYVEEEDEE